MAKRIGLAILRIILSEALAVEVVIGLFWFIFGVVLLVPVNSFAASNAYRVIALVFTEITFGIICIVMGALIIMTATGSHINARRFLMFISFIGWLGIVVSFVLTQLTTSASYLVLSLASLWVYIRLGIVKHG